MEKCLEDLPCIQISESLPSRIRQVFQTLLRSTPWLSLSFHLIFPPSCIRIKVMGILKAPEM